MSVRCFFPDSRPRGFTLIELLVVIAIIAILAAILFPVFLNAKESAQQTRCVSNLQQLGKAVGMYASDCGGYPMLSSPATAVPRTRWADYVFGYVKNFKVFSCPATQGRPNYAKPFAHHPDEGYGGYGYNYQYLGNSRVAPPNLPFTATDAMISAPSKTVAIADTYGALHATDGTVTGQGVTAVDPPIPSERGSGVASGYYADTTYANGGRALPAERHSGRVTIVFADGHSSSMTLKQLDDSNGDGVVDNGFFNGHKDPNRR